MIAYIKGTVEQITEQAVVLDYQGMGFLINVSTATLGRLPRSGETVKLYTHMQVREDGISLFGFLSQEERHMFNLLISVSGIGPKAATGVLSVLSPSQVMIAIITDDIAALSKAPGVGKKMAQRISLELRDKIKTKDALSDEANAAAFSVPLASSEKQDAIDALLALGYSRSEGMKAVLEVAVEGMSAEQIIKSALKKLAR